jgi:glutamine amidotransferase
MIAIIDYDMGNLRSVEKALTKLGATVKVTREESVIKDASHVVLPGVGAFSECMRNLEEYGLIDTTIDAIRSGKPFLGICLGLQLLFTESEERHGEAEITRGLDVIKGIVKGFPSNMTQSGSPLKVPHMGWNSITKKKESPLLKDIPDSSYFYFVHSYFAVPEDESVILTTTEYGHEFTSAVAKDNILACQFHPEKSQALGLKLLKDFTLMS